MVYLSDKNIRLTFYKKTWLEFKWDEINDAYWSRKRRGHMAAPLLCIKINNYKDGEKPIEIFNPNKKAIQYIVNKIHAIGLRTKFQEDVEKYWNIFPQN